MKRELKFIIIFAVLGIILFSAHLFYTRSQNPFLRENVKLTDNTTVSSQKLFDKNWQTIKNEYYDSSFNRQHWARWKNHYQNKIKTEEDVKVATDTMLASLNDNYSRFLTKKEFEEQNISITSKFSGIGVNIINNAGKIVIINVIENTPAYFADIKPEDIIIAVDGTKVSGMKLAEVSNLVKGPANTFVSIEILRGEEKLNKKIIRKEISIKTVSSSAEKDIGYIQIKSFISNSTPQEFLEALENTDKTKGLIIDLRGNTGGLLANAVFISNLFIEKGRLVSIVGRHGYKFDVMAQDTNVHIKKPIILLVDGASASASEILSGALKDYNKAKILGTKTYGKGMVQKIIPMPNKTGLNLTIAKYLTPKGNDINKQGITPDIVIPFNYTDEKNDAQIEKAKLELSKMISHAGR